MIAWAPLAAADIEPYLKLIGLIVAVSIMAINHLLAGLKKARAQLPPPPEANAPQNPVAAASTRQDLNAEVKEFLRRAAQQRVGQRPSAPAVPSAGQFSEGLRNEGQRNEGQRSAAARKQKHKSRQAMPVAPSVPKLEDSLANRHMTSRLESSALDDRAEQLSSLDKLTEIDARTLKTLDRDVSRLASDLTSLTTNGPTADATANAGDLRSNSAADIAALLSSPQSIRTAMILNEILARPADRW